MSERARPVETLEVEGSESPPESPSSFYNEAPIGLCYLDLELRFVHVNNWLAAVNGLTVEEHLGRTIREVIPEVAQGVEEQLRQVLTSGEPIDAGTRRSGDAGRSRGHEDLSTQLLSREIARRRGGGGELRRSRCHGAGRL